MPSLPVILRSSSVACRRHAVTVAPNGRHVRVHAMTSGFDSAGQCAMCPWIDWLWFVPQWPHGWGPGDFHQNDFGCWKPMPHRIPMSQGNHPGRRMVRQVTGWMPVCWWWGASSRTHVLWGASTSTLSLTTCQGWCGVAGGGLPVLSLAILATRSASSFHLSPVCPRTCCRRRLFAWHCARMPWISEPMVTLTVFPIIAVSAAWLSVRNRSPGGAHSAASASAYSSARYDDGGPGGWIM